MKYTTQFNSSTSFAWITTLAMYAYGFSCILIIPILFFPLFAKWINKSKTFSAIEEVKSKGPENIDTWSMGKRYLYLVLLFISIFFIIGIFLIIPMLMAISYKDTQESYIDSIEGINK